MEKLDGRSMDLEKHSIEKIKELFPEVITEGKIDFDRLRHILGDGVDESDEKYQFTWNGKRNTIKLAQKPSTGTLRPANEESKNWDTTENLYIEGDNLEVLKQLQKTYFGKVKTIYIDPPYNTGGDFVYKDDFKDSIKNYKEQTNQTSRSNADTSGRYHTDWLNMMYSRMLLTKNILNVKGVIFVSIDYREYSNINKVLIEVFGEANKIGEFIWEKHKAPKNDNNFITINHEMVLVYAKDKNNFNIHKNLRSEKNKSGFSNPDKDSRGPWTSGPLLAPTFNSKTVFPISSPNGNVNYPPKGKCWSFNEKGIEKLIVENRISFGASGNNVPRIKRFLSELSQNIGVTSFLSHDIYGGNQKASYELKSLFDGNKIFDYSKPDSLIKYLIDRNPDKNSLVLDFFSGSATTAHAVMKLNAEDGGNRKFIMVQLPEKTDEKSEAHKAGYNNICEIGKERIRRAGEQIKQEMEKEGKDSSNLDIGFKVFKLDDTNIKEWDSSLEVSESTLFDQKEIFKEDRTEEDVLYEILLKYGVFDMPVCEIDIFHKKAYDIGQGDMVVALFDDITAEDVRAIGDLKPRVVIFKDSGFKDDNVKLNALHNLQRQGVEDVKSI